MSVDGAPTIPAPRRDARDRLVRKRLGLRKMLGATGLVVAVVSVFTDAREWLPQRSRSDERHDVESAAPLTVLAGTRDEAMPAVTVAGELGAAQRAALYAPTTGYVRRLFVHVGDRVRRGQIVVDVEAPEQDALLAQGRAALKLREAVLNQIEASQRYAQVRAVTKGAPTSDGFVAQRDGDDVNNQAAVLGAIAAATRAGIVGERERLKELEGLGSSAQVTAPFDGVVMKRLVEVGEHVTGGAAPEALLEIARTDPLIVSVRMPAGLAPRVRPGAPVDVVVRGLRAQRPREGSLTMVVKPSELGGQTPEAEVTVPNASGELMPGMECELTLPLEAPTVVAVVPASALVFDSRGPHVATIGRRGHVRFVAVQPGRYLGEEVEIVAGLAGGERVLAAPPPGDLPNGMTVGAFRR